MSYPAPPYGANHMRVRYHRGSASAQLCEGCCGSAAKDWALLHGKSGIGLEDYVPLCRRCHAAYDAETRTMGFAKRSLNPDWQASRQRMHRDNLGRFVP